MSKAVLISIRPEWCEKIASGQKTVEVRKTRPKIDTPFKCYIYCTKAKSYFANYGLYGDELFKLPNGKVKFGCSMELACYDSSPNKYNEENFLNGKVIGEFICDRIHEFQVFENGNVQDWWFGDLDKSCLEYDEVAKYIGRNKKGYSWHISDLVIYDTPKKLSEFVKPGFIKFNEMDPEELCTYCADTDYGEKAFYGTPNGPVMCEGAYCDRAYQAYLDDEGFTLYRPPQSWCYVEEL